MEHLNCFMSVKNNVSCEQIKENCIKYFFILFYYSKVEIPVYLFDISILQSQLRSDLHVVVRLMIHNIWRIIIIVLVSFKFIVTMNILFTQFSIFSTLELKLMLASRYVKSPISLIFT